MRVGQMHHMNRPGRRRPIGYVGEAEDLAQTYLYLMTNRYVTGQTVVVDGGGVLV